jgi:O-antigen biosynthesis protein
MQCSQQMKLVSIITPCYNAAPFVAETIESVAAQTYPHIEHIVVDDGSTDGSWEVIQRYADRITAVRLEQNRGGSHARNRGAALARGEFLMFLDADDLISPDAMEALVDTVRERPGHIAFCSWHRLREVNGTWVKAPAELSLPGPDADHLGGWLTGIWVPPCAVLWRRDAYERTDGWDEELVANQDGDIIMRAIALGGRLTPAAGGEAYYRAHEYSRLSVSTTQIVSAAKLGSYVRVLDRVTRLLASTGDLIRYEEPLGLAYQRLALLGFQHNHSDLARECVRKGEAYAGRRGISRTWLGRALSRLLGVERKEKLVALLASCGFMTNHRRRSIQFRQSHSGGS